MSRMNLTLIEDNDINRKVKIMNDNLRETDIFAEDYETTTKKRK